MIDETKLTDDPFKADIRKAFDEITADNNLKEKTVNKIISLQQRYPEKFD